MTIDYDKLEKAAEEIRVVYTRRYGLGYPEAHVLADAIPELIKHARVQDEDILALAAQMSADMDSDAQKRAVEYEKKMWEAEQARDAALEEARISTCAMKLAQEAIQSYCDGFNAMKAERDKHAVELAVTATALRKIANLSSYDVHREGFRIAQGIAYDALAVLRTTWDRNAEQDEDELRHPSHMNNDERKR